MLSFRARATRSELTLAALLAIACAAAIAVAPATPDDASRRGPASCDQDTVGGSALTSGTQAVLNRISPPTPTPTPIPAASPACATAAAMPPATAFAEDRVPSPLDAGESSRQTRLRGLAKIGWKLFLGNGGKRKKITEQIQKEVSGDVELSTTACTRAGAAHCDYGLSDADIASGATEVGCRLYPEKKLKDCPAGLVAPAAANADGIKLGTEVLAYRLSAQLFADKLIGKQLELLGLPPADLERGRARVREDLFACLDHSSTLDHVTSCADSLMETAAYRAGRFYFESQLDARIAPYFPDGCRQAAAKALALERFEACNRARFAPRKETLGTAEGAKIQMACAYFGITGVFEKALRQGLDDAIDFGLTGASATTANIKAVRDVGVDVGMGCLKAAGFGAATAEAIDDEVIAAYAAHAPDDFASALEACRDLAAPAAAQKLAELRLLSISQLDALPLATRRALALEVSTKGIADCVAAQKTASAPIDPRECVRPLGRLAVDRISRALIGHYQLFGWAKSAMARTRIVDKLVQDSLIEDYDQCPVGGELETCVSKLATRSIERVARVELTQNPALAGRLTTAEIDALIAKPFMECVNDPAKPEIARCQDKLAVATGAVIVRQAIISHPAIAKLSADAKIRQQRVDAILAQVFKAGAGSYDRCIARLRSPIEPQRCQGMVAAEVMRLAVADVVGDRYGTEFKKKNVREGYDACFGKVAQSTEARADSSKPIPADSAVTAELAGIEDGAVGCARDLAATVAGNLARTEAPAMLAKMGMGIKFDGGDLNSLEKVAEGCVTKGLASASTLDSLERATEGLEARCRAIGMDRGQSIVATKFRTGKLDGLITGRMIATLRDQLAADPDTGAILKSLPLPRIIASLLATKSGKKLLDRSRERAAQTALDYRPGRPVIEPKPDATDRSLMAEAAGQAPLFADSLLKAVLPKKLPGQIRKMLRDHTYDKTSKLMDPVTKQPVEHIGIGDKDIDGLKDFALAVIKQAGVDWPAISRTKQGPALRARFVAEVLAPKIRGERANIAANIEKMGPEFAEVVWNMPSVQKVVEALMSKAMENVMTKVMEDLGKDDLF